MIIYKEYKLIKEFPGSPELGTIRIFKLQTNNQFLKELGELKKCELFIEFWEELPTK